jgi:hypothetical protein
MMESTPVWFLVVQTIAAFAIVFTFFVYYRQLRTMKESNLSQNLITVHQFLLDPEFRDARRALLGLQGKAIASWTNDERQSAERACASWNFVAILVDKKLLPFFVLEDAKHSYTRCHEAAKELLQEIRGTRTPDHWHHFTDYAKRLG